MNLTPVSQQLQGTVVLKKQQILETRELAFAITDKMSDRQLLTHMGILNSLIWRAATDYQAIRKDDNGVERVVSENWNNLLVCSVQGEVQITIPVDWTDNYLRTYWPGAFHDQKTVRTYRKQQLSWGLFAYDIENRPKGAAWGKANGIPCQGIATPPVLERVDVARILIFYQMFDQIRRSRINEKLKNSEDVTAFNCMPDHGGMVMVVSTKNIEVTSILHQLHGFSQVSPKKNGRLRQLKKLINQRKLTESLEMLEKTGISGDFALFIIQNIQTLEVV